MLFAVRNSRVDETAVVCERVGCACEESVWTRARSIDSNAFSCSFPGSSCFSSGKSFTAHLTAMWGARPFAMPEEANAASRYTILNVFGNATCSTGSFE